jgi:hypothetical protein
MAVLAVVEMGKSPGAATGLVGPISHPADA